jgi:hypothetical protein
MDTADLNELCPTLGKDNSTLLNIVYDDRLTISVLYKPADIIGCTRSVVVFGSSSSSSSSSWSSSEAHMFCIKSISADLSLEYAVLLKLHTMLKIAFCKLIGLGGDTVIKMNTLYDEIAPWTITMVINPDYGVLGDFSKVKARILSGTHLFYLVQNQSDTANYATYKKRADLFKGCLIQGWTYQTPASTFYNDAVKNHHAVTLDKAITFDFLDWMSYRMKDAESTVAIYKLNRMF